MSKPLIHKAAQIRLGEIWDYTAKKWGGDQADKYLRELGGCINGLQSERHLWRTVKDKRLPGVFFVRCQHHFVFFRQIDGRIAVISVLHESMDIVQRLREDDESNS